MVDNYTLLDRYMVMCQNRNLTEQSLRAMEFELKVYLRFIGDKPIIETSYIDVENYTSHCRMTLKNKSHTIARKQTFINGFYKGLIQRGYVKMQNPMDRIDKYKIRKVVKDYLTPDELDKLYKVLEDRGDLRGTAYVKLSYASACRLGEILQLNRDSLDYNTMTFRVTGKGDKQRICMFTDEAGKAVKEYLESRTDDETPLFLSMRNKRWTHASVWCFMKSIVEKAGINKCISSHSLRHSAATNLRKAGLALEDLQLLLGHENIGTTQSVYTHVGFDDIRERVVRLLD